MNVHISDARNERYNYAHYCLPPPPQMSSFRSEVPGDSLGVEMTHETPLYLLARDEDCENSFHSTADFVSAEWV